MLNCKALWTLLRGSFNAYVRSSLCVSSDLPGVNPATLSEMLLYYRLMTKWSGLGDSTELSRMGLSHWLGKERKERSCLDGLLDVSGLVKCNIFSYSLG
jgi:hypothetical protein